MFYIPKVDATLIFLHPDILLPHYSTFFFQPLH